MSNPLSKSSRPRVPANSRRTGVRRLLEKVITGSWSGETETSSPRKGRLLLESLEQRQLMAGDMDLLFTDGTVDATATNTFVATNTSGGLQTTTQPEGEAAPDLVQFAKDLTAAGVLFFGAEWCPACTAQKELFQDGKDDLPFIEVTNPDRSLNARGIAEGITEFPTWVFPTGEDLLGLQSLQTLSQRAGVPIPTSDQPTFEPVGNLSVAIGSPLHVPIDAYDPGGGPLTVSVSVADPTLLEATVLTGNRSIRIDMNGYGDMVFQLFEDRAPIASGRIADLADSGFYDGIIFHRVVDNFVIQAGDPLGNGTGGSSLPNIDDDFHPDLQHNREGVLSFAKTTDDTNNSQFFITETPTRNLDFNHSIFGQLVEGFDVREAISETAVNNASSNKPINDVVINTIDVFNDTENGVVMLKPTGNRTGTTNVTFTVTDANGNTFSETVSVNVVADTVNSRPFLGPIAPTVTVPSGGPGTLQLTSIDVEGDSVFYTARSASPAANGTVSVNSTTGLVTVTPAAGFTGQIVANVGVSGAAISASATPDDNQRVVFNVGAANAVATPSAVDLQTGSDTGSSNIDNITNAGSLTFRVSGVTVGATVELVNTATGSVVGTGIADAVTVVITTNNISALGDGTYPIAARQRVGTNVSALSPALSVTYDQTIPASVIASASTQANVGRQYLTDLISTEEGSGLVYALVERPTGAVINATTGVITWTPTTAQLGANTFRLSLTDAAGNVRNETLTVNVAGAPRVEVDIELTDLNGNRISSIATGQEFFLNLVGVDARSFTKPGVYAIYADILFDNTLIAPVPGSQIQFDEDFTVEPSGVFSNGLIDELGGQSNRTQAQFEARSRIATVRMRAISAGTVNIRSEPAERDENVLVFGENNIQPADTVAYNSATLAIGQSFTVGVDTFAVAEDSGSTTLNVLANDTIVSGGGTLSVVSVTQPASGGTVTLTGGTVRFEPTANFNGNAVFTYRVANTNGGSQQDGSVTVTVTPVNDPPTAVADTLTVEQNSTNNTLNLLANDTITPDTGETLTITAVGATSAGGTVTIAQGGGSVVYTPATGFVGTETFTYTIRDGALAATATATVTVESTDNPPTAVADAFTVAEDAAEAVFNVVTNDTRDADNQAFVISAVGTPSNGGTARVSADGTQFFYRPAANFAGTETVTYTIRDTGGGASTATVTFTVTPVNDVPPVLNSTVRVNRGGTTPVERTVLRLTDLPANVDAGETLTITLGATTTPAGGTARVDATTRTIFYTAPAGAFTGTDSITYTVSDGTLTSTGTLTLNVVDFETRDIDLNYQFLTSSNGVTLGNVMLRGTNVLEETVELFLSVTPDRLFFDRVLPGSYTVEIPAIPFLQNASEPRSIAVESLPEDGNMTVDLDLGQLRARYISIQDWLGKSARQNLLVAVTPGQSSIMVIPSARTTAIQQPVVQLDASGTTMTIQGNRSNSTTNAIETVSASMPTANNARVQSRGEVDGVRLFKVSVEPSAVTFAPTTSASAATTTTTTTGSAAGAALQVVAPETTMASPAGQAFSSSTLMLGDSAAEGESFAASSVTMADVFSPGIADTEPDAIVDASPASLVGSDAIDSAMESVTPSLTRVSTVEDTLASGRLISASAIDEAIRTDLG